jgi:hypothetical protein
MFNRLRQTMAVAVLAGSCILSICAAGAVADPLFTGRGDASPSPSPSPTPSPTPFPWREIPMTTQTLEQAQPTGGIQVLSAFAAAKRDGKSAIACISFKNLRPVAAIRILFDFPLIDGYGGAVGTLHLDRAGTFSSGIDIMSFQSFGDWKGGGGNGDYNKSCAKLDLGMAAMPILAARYATFHIARVEFADGTTWPTGGNATQTPP